MLLAELEVFHSRPIAPTRRVALGRTLLPADPPPGFGGLLLGGIVARFAQDLDFEDIGELRRLLFDLNAGHNISQPRLRHRFQVDRVGLARSSHRLYRTQSAEGNKAKPHSTGELRLEFTVGKGAPCQHVLAAVYAAGRLPTSSRNEVFATIRRALAWRGEVNSEFMTHIADGATSSFLSASLRDMSDNVGWAKQVLGMGGTGKTLDKHSILRSYRDALLVVHPDYGGEVDKAAARIADITEARRILLAAPLTSTDS